MNTARAQAVIAAKKAAQSSSAGPSMPPPPPPDKKKKAVAEEGPALNTAGPAMSTPLPTRAEGSKAKETSSMDVESISHKRGGDRLTSTRADKRPSGSQFVKEIEPDVGLRTSEPPKAKTRNKSYSPPASTLLSMDLDIAVKFLQDMINSSDKYAMEPLPSRERLKAAMQYKSKSDVLLAGALLDAYNSSETSDLKNKLARSQETFKKAQEYGNKQAEAVKKLKEEVQTLKARRSELEVQLADEVATKEDEKKAAVAVARQSWVKKLPQSTEGRALVDGFKEDFLKSAEFESILDSKTYDFFAQGFAGCVAQFKVAGYPPEGADASFLDVDAALLSWTKTLEGGSPKDVTPGPDAEQPAQGAPDADQGTPATVSERFEEANNTPLPEDEVTP